MYIYMEFWKILLSTISKGTIFAILPFNGFGISQRTYKVKCVSLGVEQVWSRWWNEQTPMGLDILSLQVFIISNLWCLNKE